MFKVFIEGEEFHSVEFSRQPRIEDAVALALSLHRSSNCKHVISVYDVCDEKVVLLFKRDDVPCGTCQVNNRGEDV